MQMAKTSQALGQLDDAGMLTVSLITDPTYGGVAASFATLGDVIIAEPGARMGFAGPRVIEQTIRPGTAAQEFQTAEFLLEHGLVDIVCARPSCVRPWPGCSPPRSRARARPTAAARAPAPRAAAPEPVSCGTQTGSPTDDAWSVVRQARNLTPPDDAGLHRPPDRRLRGTARRPARRAIARLSSAASGRLGQHRARRDRPPEGPRRQPS